MKRLIITLAAIFCLSLAAYSQPKIANNCIGLQIGQKIDFLFDQYGQIEQGEVKVTFIIDKHNNLQVQDVESNNPLLLIHMKEQIQGMKLDVKKEDRETLLYLSFVFQTRSDQSS